MMVTEAERDDARLIISSAIQTLLKRRKDKRELTPTEVQACSVKRERLVEYIEKLGGPVLGDDWWCECEMRRGGSSQGSYDFYFYHQSAANKNHRFRSNADVARFLGLHPPERPKKVAKKAALQEQQPPDFPDDPLEE